MCDTPVASRSPSGNTLTTRCGPSLCKSMARSIRPVPASQITARWSEPSVANRAPSGKTWASKMLAPAAWPPSSAASKRPDHELHTTPRPSEPTVTSRSPAGKKRMSVTLAAAGCPWSTCCRCPCQSIAGAVPNDDATCMGRGRKSNTCQTSSCSNCPSPRVRCNLRGNKRVTFRQRSVPKLWEAKCRCSCARGTAMIRTA
mmetsp:Transcript_56297/g.163270  ORF Transcript_56297/g.163270 Transcript_56297/m.163270 type:complete len:201 (-) Transcript_56297:151-753(-)